MSEELYYALIYKKIKITDNSYAFKCIGMAKNAIMDYEDYFYEIQYTDDNNEEKRVKYLENPYYILSDEDICYYYSVDKESLLEEYGYDLDDDELAEMYFSSIKNSLVFTYYDKEEDGIKVFTTNEVALHEYFDKEEFLRSCYLSYDSDEEERLSLSLKDLKDIVKLIEDNQTSFLKERILETSSENQYQRERFKHAIKVMNDKETVADILSELNNLTGLDNVKERVEKLRRNLVFRDKTKDLLNLKKPNLHMVFNGNPGTGKTTVARIIGKLLYKMGYVKNNTFAEATPRELIAEYVGQTAVKTKDFIDDHKGGVIFIDEAYILSGKAQEFGDEAIVEILKELEKNETVFIFAGYKNEMEQFIEMNPGLESRIGIKLNYKDYSLDELYNIFETKVNNMKLKIDNDVKDKVINILESAMKEEHFGNGRFIDNLIDNIILEHAFNTEQITDIEYLTTIHSEDINNSLTSGLFHKPTTKQIGFHK